MHTRMVAIIVHHAICVLAFTASWNITMHIIHEMTPANGKGPLSSREPRRDHVC